MDVKAGIDAGSESPFVSTGRLPSEVLVQELVEEAVERYRPNAEEGQLASAFLSRRLGLDLFASKAGA